MRERWVHRKWIFWQLFFHPSLELSNRKFYCFSGRQSLRLCTILHIVHNSQANGSSAATNRLLMSTQGPGESRAEAESACFLLNTVWSCLQPDRSPPRGFRGVISAGDEHQGAAWLITGCIHIKKQWAGVSKLTSPDLFGGFSNVSSQHHS